MRTIKKILVPIDFCEESASAFLHALGLAKEARAELIVLHVIDSYALRNFFLPATEDIERPTLDRLNASLLSLDTLRSKKALALSTFINKHARVHGGIVITRKVRMGSVVKEIAATAWEESIDLIVVELRKRFPFLNLTVLRLLQLSRKLPCPVLLEPAVSKGGRTAMGRLISPRAFPRERVA